MNTTKTRQSEFLKIFTVTKIDENGVIDICPRRIRADMHCYIASSKPCPICRRQFWLAPLEGEE